MEEEYYKRILRWNKDYPYNKIDIEAKLHFYRSLSPATERGKEITEARIRALERLRNDRDKQCNEKDI